jgi:ATP-dependent helicase/nuclease subunit A
MSKASAMRRHEVIRASAGAGKTFELSSRYLRLLCRGVSPATILAITFTRKAAGEILGRVLRRLAEASPDQAAAGKLAQQLGESKLTHADVCAMLDRLCNALPRVAVSTIDSFFNSVARAYRAELGIPANLTLVGEDDPLARQVRLDAIDAMLGDDDLDVLLGLLRRLHQDEPRRGVTDAIDHIVRDLYEVYRITEAAAWHVLQPPAGDLDAASIASAVEALSQVGALLGNQKSWRTAWEKDCAAANAHDWETFTSRGIAAAVAKDKTTFGSVKRDLPQGVLDAYRPLVRHAEAISIARLARRTHAMFDLLDRYHRHYQRFRREAAVMLFGDLPSLLEGGLPYAAVECEPDALAAREELYYRLDRRVQHLLLDEFQDTSPAQWNVVQPIAQEIASWGDPESLERTFFCVGDTKQAIYGWRGGSAAIFDRVEHDLHLPAEGKRRLKRSWRSSPVVLDVVNRVFGGIVQLPPLSPLAEPVTAWASGFDKHEAVLQNRPGYVEVMNTRLGGASDDDDGDDEPGEAVILKPHETFVADRIARLHDTYEGRSIGVLVRTNRMAAKLVHALRELAVEVSGEGGSILTDDAAVMAVLAALQLADHPGDTAAAFHVRHSPLGSVLQLTVGDTDEAACVGLAVRRRLIDEGFAPVLADWARRIASDCAPRNTRRLVQLIELADAYDASTAGRSLRARDFIAHVQAAAVESPSSSAVRVMTVHKAKGLEFDVVVLPELEGVLGNTTRQQVWTLRPDETSPPEAVFARVNHALLEAVEKHEPRVRDALLQEQARRLHDDLCALYVALTRPRYALHVMLMPVKPKSDGTPGKRGLHDASAAAVLRHTLTDVSDDDLATGEDKIVFTHGDPMWHKHEAAPPTVAETPSRPPKVKLAKPDAASKRSWVTVTPSSLEDQGVVSAARLLRLSDDPAMMRGSVIHSYFQQIEWIENPIDLDDAQPFVEDFRRMLDHTQVRVALSRGDREGIELWRERSFAVHVGDRMLQGVFDRVEIDRKTGRARLIDFKTDRHTDAAVNRYRPQIDAYRVALAAMLGWDVAVIDAMLLFVGDGVAVTVQAAPNQRQG